MRFQGTILNEQGVTFAVVIVKKHVLDNQMQARETIQAFQPAFPTIPIILMAQDHRNVPSYYGRDDLARFMASVAVEAIPWQEYSV